ncbi:MAG: hypothetical protein IPG35_17330 [Flavobacteriales bacterium]|nr:hypothetical protein [Flavobacteriales bacterium]
MGVVEAKKPKEAGEVHRARGAGHRLCQRQTAVDHQPEHLPFIYLSTGEVTRHWDMRGPQGAPARVFSFHRPERLAGMAEGG